MTQAITMTEYELLQQLRMLSPDEQTEVLDFIMFLIQKVKKHQEKTPTLTEARAAVERTWGTITLDKDTLMYIAEDKELEYDVE